MIVTVKHYEDWPCFNETFFISAAEIGVRSVIFDPDGEYASSGSTSGRGYFTGIDVLGALAFGFAEPTTGGKRSLSKMLVSDADKRIGPDFYENVNFLAPLVKARKARELDGRQRINFKFTIDKLAKPICPVGFEKYQEDICSWLIDGLENGIVLKVVEAYRVVEIHVFYSV
ncbi:hypothetical protein AAVH_06790 [Aphelenchoides avenae]|nr:hypothetical protein AAVH_06790 [Aphelenchus avenae]